MSLDREGQHTPKRAYHSETPIAPSIHGVALKNIPWWCSVVAWSSEFVVCTTSESLALTTTGGGLMQIVSRRQLERAQGDLADSRPGPIDAYHASFGEAIRVGILHIGDVPPDFMHACEDGRGKRRKGDDGLHPGRYGRGR